MYHRPPPPRRRRALLEAMPTATAPIARRQAGPAVRPHVPDAALQDPVAVVAVAYIRLRRRGGRVGAYGFPSAATDDRSSSSVVMAVCSNDPFRRAFVPYGYFALGVGARCQLRDLLS